MKKSERPLREDLRDQILARILNGELKPGMPLREVELAKSFNISRVPLREAMFLLEREGFVISEPDCGFKVSPLSLEELRNLYPIIESLETLALRQGWRATAGRVTELKKINQQFSHSKGQAALELDTAWHTLLCQGSGNAILSRMLNLLRLRIARYERLFMEDTPSVERSVAQHAAVLDQLEHSNPDKAAQALSENWLSGLGTLVDLLVARGV